MAITVWCLNFYVQGLSINTFRFGNLLEKYTGHCIVSHIMHSYRSG